MEPVPRPPADVQPLNAGFDDKPDDYDRLRTAGHMARRRAEYFRAAVSDCPGMVLEIGCGTGSLLRELAAAHPDRWFVGVDPLPGYVDFAREAARREGLRNVRFACGVGEELDDLVPPGSVGLLISVDALHHVSDLDRVLAAAARVTAEGGRWRAMEPNRAHPYVWLYHTLTRGERTFAVRAFLHRAGHAGWTAAGRSRMFAVPSGVPVLPPPLAAAERWVERVPVLAGAVVLDLVREPVSGATGR